MITFTCTGCGRSFTVPEQYAGRRAKCKECGASVEVPAFAHAARSAVRTSIPRRPLRLPEAAPAGARPAHPDAACGG